MELMLSFYYVTAKLLPKKAVSFIIVVIDSSTSI